MNSWIEWLELLEWLTDGLTSVSTRIYTFNGIFTGRTNDSLANSFTKVQRYR